MKSPIYIKKKARTFHFCMGDMECKGVFPDDEYYSCQRKIGSRAYAVCINCAKNQVDDNGKHVWNIDVK